MTYEDYYGQKDDEHCHVQTYGTAHEASGRDADIDIEELAVFRGQHLEKECADGKDEDLQHGHHYRSVADRLGADHHQSGYCRQTAQP